MTNPQAAMAGNISPRSTTGLSWSVQKNSRDQIEESPGFRLHLLSLNFGDMLMDCTLRLRHGILKNQGQLDSAIIGSLCGAARSALRSALLAARRSCSACSNSAGGW